MAQGQDNWDDQQLADETANMNMGGGRGRGRGGQGGYYQQGGYNQQYGGGYYQGGGGGRGGRGGQQGGYNPGAPTFVPQANAQAFYPGQQYYPPQQQGYGRGGYGGYQQGGYGGYQQNYQQGGYQYQQGGYQGGYQQGGYQQPAASQQQQPAAAAAGGRGGAQAGTRGGSTGGRGGAQAERGGKGAAAAAASPRVEPAKPQAAAAPAPTQSSPAPAKQEKPAPTPAPAAEPSPAATANGESDDWEKDADEGATPAPTPAADSTPAPAVSDSAPATAAAGGSAEGGASAPVAEAPKPKPKSKKRVFVEEKEHLNVLFIGHVDAGKSTIGGQIMAQTGMVDKRTLEKYEREAKEKNRESWYLSWCMDTNAEERDKGKTVEVGRAHFNTEKKRFTVLDAPGHKSFVPNMISGAAQADVGILVISARKGEFEAGFDKGGQTREHAMLAKTAGIKFLVVLVNKMDDPSVCWDPERYDEIVNKLTPFLKKTGYNMKDVHILPASGLTGANIKDGIPAGTFDYYKGPSLLDYLDNLKPMERMNEAPVRLPIIEKFKDMGTMVLGKLESGVITRGDSLMLMPNKVLVEVQELAIDEEDIEAAGSGNNIRLKLKNIDENDVHVGHVLCDPDQLVPSVRVFDVQLMVLEVENIICAGYTCVLHIHAAAEEVKFAALIATLDRKGEIVQKKPRFIKQDMIVIARLETLGGAVCMELFKEFPQLGRFTLRDKGKTIAIGKVVKLVS
eukprot:comp22195_c0_seq1/m.32625 comp22195_c0_seq1/g.32625  ORF comp22195_c0_seq1/g.32625 comp22195_c0_seq1/m.32625 type:complete len:734 (-) comp22195_c0_seq1:503-2704(-)